MSSTPALDCRLEERLLRSKAISDDQLSLARELQKEASLSLAQALVELELLNAREIERIVESIHEVRFVKLEDMQVDREAVRHIPARIARQYRCIPVRRSGNMLVIAASNPKDAGLRETLSGVTDCELLIVAAEPDAIEHALYLHYTTEGQSGNVSLTSAIRTKSEYAVDPWDIPNPWTLSFETFISHDGSRRARELAKQVASYSQEPIDYPIILVGDVGTGKTHLLTAIRNYCSIREPLMRGLYCTGEELQRKYWEFKIAGQLSYFQYEMRDRQCVLIDDVAALFGDQAVECELISLIRHYSETGSRVVLSMTPEQRLSGPVTAELRNTLDKGTEDQLSGMNRDVFQAFIATRVQEKALSCVTKQCIDQTERLSWANLQDCLKNCSEQHG